MANRTPRISRDRELTIAGLAQRIALNRLKGARVEPEAIAEAEGISFRYAPFLEEFDGTLLHDAGRFYIVCNERRSKRGSSRSRFTFAHELGHYFLEEHRLALVSGKVPSHFSLAEFASDQPIEREADLFASHLLMPPEIFCERAKESEPGMEQIEALSDYFGTSLTSTAFHALKWGIFLGPAAVFRWDSLGTLKGRRLSPGTFLYSSDYRYMADSPPKGSLTEAAVKGLKVGARQGSANALGWFPYLENPAESENSRLREEVLSLGHYGWLTLVYEDLQSR